jgi:hypothetical protein
VPFPHRNTYEFIRTFLLQGEGKTEETRVRQHAQKGYSAYFRIDLSDAANQATQAVLELSTLSTKFDESVKKALKYSQSLPFILILFDRLTK